jgi:uroporphyrin-3 C-methyltransferase
MKKRNKIITENKASADSITDTDKTLDNSTPKTEPTAQSTAKSSEKVAAQDAISKVDDKVSESNSPATADKAEVKSEVKKESPAKEPKDTAKNAVKDTAKAADNTPKKALKSTHNTTAKSTVKENSASGKSAKLALVVSIIALGLVGFQYYQQMQSQDENTAITAKISGLQQALERGIKKAQDTSSSIQSEAQASVAKANSAIASVNANLAALKQAETQKSDDIDSLQARLTKSIQQVEASGLQQNSRKDWLLAEVEYLLRLANQRVLMENTPIGALALLESADKILQQTDDVSIFAVRKSLAADIAALSAIPHIDQEGLYLKIDALSAQINQLKLVPITDKKQLPKIIDEVATDAVNEAQQSSLAKIWDKASAKLEKLVVINNRDAAIEPLLSPAQQAGLLQNLHILFEQTQLALLQRKQVPYQRSIEKAELIINTHFQEKDGVSQALLNGLKSLKDEKVSVDLPSIAGSLNALKAYLKQAAQITSGAQS